MQTTQFKSPNALARIDVARDLLGYSRSQLYARVKEKLLTEPVKIGPRAAAFPLREIDAINAARIAGKSDADIRALVERLHAARQSAA